MNPQEPTPPNEVASEVLHGTPLSASDATQSGQIPDSSNKIPTDSHWITILAMAIFVLLSLGAVVFLYYQNQQLKSMLVGYRVQSSPTPLTTPNPIADWKIYKSTKYPYQINYPSELVYEKADVSEAIEQAIFKNSGSDQPLTSFSVYVSKGKLPEFPLDHEPTGKHELSGIQGVYLELPEGYSDGFEANPPPQVGVYVENNLTLYKITFFGVSDINNKIVDQILSTFKFIKTEDITACVPLPDCAYNANPSIVCKIGEKPPSGGSWCPRPTSTPQ